MIVRSFSEEGERLIGCRFALSPARALPSEAVDKYPMSEVEEGVHLRRHLPAGEYDLLCRAPIIKEPVAIISWSGTGRQEIDVHVAARADMLGGIVRRVSGDPVKGAFVWAVDEDSATAYWCVSDEQGRFGFHRAAGNTSRTARFLLSDDLGEARITDSRSPVELAWGNLCHVITAEQRADLVVRLKNSSGQTVEHFTAETASRNVHGQVRKRNVSSEGVARVVGVPTGKARLLVVPDPAWLPVRGEVEVASDGSGYANLVTTEAARLAGTVSAAEGDLGLDGCAVVASLAQVGQGQPPDRAAGPEAQFSVRIGDAASSDLDVQQAVRDGRFEFGCDPRFAYRLRVKAAGYIPFDRTVRAFDGVFSRVDVKLQPAVTLRARVHPLEAVGWLQRYAEQDNTAAARRIGVFILLKQPLPGVKRTEMIAEPSADGLVEFNSVSPGKWLLVLRGPVKSPLLATLDIGPEQVVEPLPIDLEYLRPGLVQGRLRCERDGIHPRLLVVMAYGGGRFSIPLGQDGTFSFDAPKGTYQLRVSALDSAGDSLVVSQGRATQVVAGETTQVSFDLVLERVSIQLVDNQTGAPIPNASLSVDEERATKSYRVLRTDALGFAVLDPCPLGEFGISILDETTSIWSPLTRRVAGGENPLVIKLRR